MLLGYLKPKLQEVIQEDSTYPCQKTGGSNKWTLANCIRWFWRYSRCLSLCFDSEMRVVGISVFSAATVTWGLCWRYIKCANLSWSAAWALILPYSVYRILDTGSISELDYRLWRILQCWVGQYWSPLNVDHPFRKTQFLLYLSKNNLQIIIFSFKKKSPICIDRNFLCLPLVVCKSELLICYLEFLS